MEGSGGNEQNMICFHGSVARLNGASFYDREKIPLHTHSGYFRSLAFAYTDYFIYLINEDDAFLLRERKTSGNVIASLEQSSQFFFMKSFSSFCQSQYFLFASASYHFLHQLFQILTCRIIESGSRHNRHYLHLSNLVGKYQFNFGFVEKSFFDHSVDLSCFKGSVLRILQRFSQFTVNRISDLFLSLLSSLSSFYVHSLSNKGSDHRFNIPAHVTGLGIFGSFDLNKGGTSHISKSLCYFGFTNAGRPHHYEIAWIYL